MEVKRKIIPQITINMISDALADFYYSHRAINDIFLQAEAPELEIQGSCRDKCKNWLKAINDDERLNPFSTLGRIIEDIMENDTLLGRGMLTLLDARTAINTALNKRGLSYIGNGQIAGADLNSSVKSLSNIFRNRDLRAMEIEFNRCLENIEKDPPASLTAASCLIESLFQVYVEDNDLTPPKKETIKDLWKVVQKDMRLSVKSDMDDDIKRILSGLTSIVDGIGSLRTHKGSAHGRGNRMKYAVKSRHARLAVHSAHTFAIFIIETWNFRDSNKSA